MLNGTRSTQKVNQSFASLSQYPTSGRLAWVCQDQLEQGLCIGRFQSSMYKWDLASMSICECDASDQVILECPLHRAPRGYHEMLALDNEIRC